MTITILIVRCRLLACNGLLSPPKPITTRMTSQGPSHATPSHRYYSGIRSSVIPTPTVARPSPNHNKQQQQQSMSTASGTTTSPTRNRNYKLFHQNPPPPKKEEVPKTSPLQATVQAMSDRLETGLTPAALQAIVDLLQAGVPPDAVVAAVSSLSSRQQLR